MRLKQELEYMPERTAGDPSAARSPRVVRLDIDGGRALDRDLTTALVDACDAVEDGNSAALLLLRIRGTSVHRRAWPGAVHYDDVRKWEDTLRRIDRLVGLSVAVASGACGGLALELLAVSDQRIACRDLSLENLGAAGASWPGTAIHRVTRRSGASAARRLFVFPTTVQADEAQRLGLADRIVDDAEKIADMLVTEHHGFDANAAQRRRLLIEETTGGGPYEQLIGAHLAACDVELRRRAVAHAEPAAPSKATRL